MLVVIFTSKQYSMSGFMYILYVTFTADLALPHLLPIDCLRSFSDVFFWISAQDHLTSFFWVTLSIYWKLYANTS
jgi:hypothetical protein